MKMILFGPPGSGKGTQSELLEAKLGIPRITAGDILREAAKTSKELQATLQSGSLVSDALICRLISERISQKDCNNGYILDGFPRTLAQAEYLGEMKVKIDIIIALDVPDALIIERLASRRIHLASGRTYNVITAPPKVEERDDVTGEMLSIRPDDQPDSIKNRLEVYNQLTAPILAYYKGEGVNIASIDGTRDQLVVAEEIQLILSNNS